MADTRSAPALPVAVFILAWLLAACARLPSASPQAQGSAFDREAKRARAAVEALIEADNRGDLDAAMACYADNVVLAPPQGPIIEGREAVRSHYAALFARHRLWLRAEILETAVIRDTAMVRGRTTGRRTLPDGSDAETIDDQFVAELVLEADGRWRIGKLSWRPTDKVPASPGNTRTDN